MPQRMYFVLAASALIAVLPAFAAGTMHVALQIKTGLWEYRDMPKVAGDTIFPDSMLAHVPAARRAQFLAETRKQLAEPHKARECMTHPKFEQRVSLRFGSCTRSVLSNTLHGLEIRTACRSESPNIRQETTQRIVMLSPAMVTISTHAVSKRDGKTMTLDSTEIGRWIGADCGSLKNGVIQQLP